MVTCVAVSVKLIRSVPLTETVIAVPLRVMRTTAVAPMVAVAEASVVMVPPFTNRSCTVPGPDSAAAR